MNFIDYENLLERLLTIIIEKYPEFVAIGGFVLAVMAIGTLVLTLAIIYLGFNIPVTIVKDISKKIRD